MIVASPAPNTPIAGIKPNPKMNNGSNTMFKSNPVVVAINEVLLFHIAVNIPVNI